MATIQNVVSSAHLCCKLNLKHIARNTYNVVYKPKNFDAVIMKLRRPQVTVLIFSNGKIICTGAKTVADSRIGARRCARIIQKLGFNVHFQNHNVHNIVSSFCTNTKIDLYKLVSLHPSVCKYEPELFPGLKFQIPNKKPIVLIFQTGKAIITGSKTENDINNMYLKILKFLSEVGGI